jgi:hypothetical protein
MRGQGNPSARARNAGGRFADGTLSGYADLVLAVASNSIAGVFEVRGWRRDPQARGKVVFDLAEASEWRWLIGQGRRGW